MTYESIAALVGRCAEEVGNGCRWTYYQWSPEDPDSVPDPPYILFFYPERDDLYADGENYQPIEGLRLELYTDNKDFDAEAAVERILTANGLSYVKSCDYIDDERMYMALYEMEVIING